MKTHELPPWFPQDSIESLYSWQPGVSKVTPAGRIRTTDLPNRVKLAAQRKASCNICEQSLFSVWSWALRRACLFFPLFFGQTVDRNLRSTVGKRGCPRVPTHVNAWLPGEEATVRRVCSLVCGSTACSHGLQQVSLAQPTALRN